MREQNMDQDQVIDYLRSVCSLQEQQTLEMMSAQSSTIKLHQRVALVQTRPQGQRAALMAGRPAAAVARSSTTAHFARPAVHVAAHSRTAAARPYTVCRSAAVESSDSDTSEELPEPIIVIDNEIDAAATFVKVSLARVSWQWWGGLRGLRALTLGLRTYAGGVWRASRTVA